MSESTTQMVESGRTLGGVTSMWDKTPKHEESEPNETNVEVSIVKFGRGKIKRVSLSTSGGNVTRVRMLWSSIPL